MTDKIIEAAREAGFFIDEDSRKYQPRCIFHTRYLIDDELARFYAIVRNQALEDAANIVQANAQLCATGGYGHALLSSNANAIRALKETQPPQGGG